MKTTKLRIKTYLLGFLILLTGVIFAQKGESQIDPEQHKIISSDRPDGRYVSTRGLVHHLMRNAQPQLAFNPQFSKDELKEWQIQVRDKMEELMRFPVVPPQPMPKFLNKVKRDGYTVEKWEIYPQPGHVVPFLMLVPDGVSADNPAPAALCFPGSATSKETLAGEDDLFPVYATTSKFPAENRMAMYYAQQGIVAIAVDNPGIAETSDLEQYSGRRIYDRSTFSRYLLDMGWSYWGLSAFQGNEILKWMRTLDFIDPGRIALSGHSLGSEPVYSLSVLNPDIQAIVISDFTARIIKRAIVSTKPNSAGLRPRANWLGHCVPGLWEWFDYPDILASLAPRPLIITEGGPTAHLDLIKEAYRIMDAKDNLAIHYYPKYSDPKDRLDYEYIPEGLDQEEWFRYSNVDAPNHYFKADIAVPWLKKMLNQKP